MTSIRQFIILAVCYLFVFTTAVDADMRLKRLLKNRPKGKEKSKLKRELKEIGDLALNAQGSQDFVIKALPPDSLAKISELANVDFGKGGELNAVFKKRLFRSNKSRRRMINSIKAARNVVVRSGGVALPAPPPPVPRPQLAQASSAFTAVAKVTRLPQSGAVQRKNGTVNYSRLPPDPGSRLSEYPIVPSGPPVPRYIGATEPFVP